MEVSERRVVAMVTFAVDFGGAERSLLALARRLPQRGWTPVLICPPGRLADVAAALGLHVERLPFRLEWQVSRRRAGRKTYSLWASVKLITATIYNAVHIGRVVQRCDPALMHSNSLPSHMSTTLAGCVTRRPVLLHLREMIEPGPGRVVFSWFGRLASGMVAISEAVAATVVHANVHLVYNPVDGPPPEVPKPPWQSPRPVVGYIGRLDPCKGIEHLITAVGATDAHLLVAGRRHAATGAYVASLKQLAHNKAPGRVQFVGELDEPWQLLAAVDVLVVPSLAEPFGRVAVEGQRAGVAVLAADAGGLPEIVTDGCDGLLFPPADAAALARCLTLVLADEALRARVAAAGQESSQRFDSSVHANAMVELLAMHAGAATRR